MVPKKVLVIGDIIYDRYVYVKTERMSQEASDVPIYDVEEEDEVRLGGAANVAANIQALGGDEVEVYVSGICGVGEQYEMTHHGLIPNRCYASRDRMEKCRFIDGATHIFRVDNRKKFSSSDVCIFEDKMERTTFDFDAVIFSDYDKGTITKSIVKKAIESDALVIVDSKRPCLSMYRGADVLTFNLEEFSHQIYRSEYPYVEELFKYVVITMGAAGARLHWIDSIDTSIPPGVVKGRYKVSSMEFEATDIDDVVDTTGCGDTHTAAITMGLLRDPGNIIDSIIYANKCAAIAVQRFGTTRVSKWDLSKASAE